MNPEPQKEHQWLAKLVGDWTYAMEAPMKEGEPPAKFTGTEQVRSIGGLWIVGEGAGDTAAGGCASTTIVTLGYDLQKKRFVGSWIGSMMANMWVYDGWLDETGRVLTLETEGPACSGEGMARYRDVVEMVNDDLRVLSSHVQDGDGKWQELMRAEYRRKK